MSQSTVIAILKDAISTLLKCSLPMMLAALVIGVIISVLQAATQISEQTLSFVPKLIGVFLVFLACVGHIISELSDLTTRMYGYMNQMIQ